MKVSLNIDKTSGGYYGYSTKCETFPSIKSALDEFYREVSGERTTNGDEFIGYLFFGAISDCTDVCPDRMLTVGARGAIHCFKI